MYSQEELREILRKLSQQKDEVKFEKFEKLGIHTVIKANNSANFTCATCKKNLLSNHLLDLHVAEHHDSFFEIQSSKKPSFQCYLEACPFLSNTPDDRKNHCITEHKFPHDFPFETGKKLEPEKKKTSPVTMHRNFHFGHRSQKTFKSGGSSKIDMKDLMDVLPDV